MPKMPKLILICIHVLACTIFFQSSAIAQLRENRISADDLKWIYVTDDLFPKTILRQFKVEEWRPLDFTFINNSKTHRGSLVVGSVESYSGGRVYAVFEKRKSAWIKIGEFQGWFVLTFPGLSKSYQYRINSYSRHGGYEYINIYDYKGGRYTRTNQIENPIPTDREFHSPEVHYYSKPPHGQYRSEVFREYTD
jgi:hypothetical protein